MLKKVSVTTSRAYTNLDLSITLPNPRVLVLDDDRAYCEAVAKNLELLGAEVLTASSAAEAKELLEQQSFQVIIADIVLDGDRDTGDQFIVRNSQLMKGADVFVVTGYPAHEIKTINELDSLGVKVIQKRQGLMESFREIIDANRARASEEVIESISQRATSVLIKTQQVAIRRLRVFLCHASDDKPSVKALYQRLHSNEFEPWLDEEAILPGDDWKEKIEKAVRDSDVVVVCLSQRSINKRGYVQKEIKIALDIADEQPEGTIFVIPVKVEECDVPQRLRRWQWVNLFEDEGYQRLVLALETALASLQKVEK